MSPLLFNVFFAAALYVVLVRFSGDEAIVRDLIQLKDAGVVGTEEQDTLSRVKRVASGMLYASDAIIVSTSAEGLCYNDESHCDCLRSSRLEV